MSQALPQILNLRYSATAGLPREGDHGGLGLTHRELQLAGVDFLVSDGAGGASSASSPTPF